MIQLSTGLRNSLLGTNSLADILADGVIKIYTGSAPASADDAITGQELVTITKNSATTKVAKKVTLTVTVANSEDYIITLNGVELTYTSDTDATADEISAGLKTLIDDAQGLGANGVINVPKLYGLFTVIDVSGGTGQITIEAVNAGVDFDIEVSSNISLEIDRESAYGIHLDPNGIANGIISKKGSEIWSGVCSLSGVAGYFRFIKDDDDGTSNTTAYRIQGSVGTSNADMLVTSVNFASGATQTVDSGTITFPASR
jgi:uncharacterized protein YbjQ (UPF0145 family)